MIGRRPTAAPPGYVREQARRALVIAQRAHLPAVLAALADAPEGTLHGYAARHAAARPLAGRGTAYAVPLPAGPRVVVRHNQHGGALARLTGDRFLAPTRAPRELAAALRLAAHEVPTPALVAVVLYPAGLGGLLARSDVATAEIAPSSDLAAVLAHQAHGAARAAALEATARLVAQLARAGARHHDLNLKNVLLAQGAEAERALVLDVDRVTFHAPSAELLERNLARLLRSARKWRDRWGAPITEAELSLLASRARTLFDRSVAPPR